MAILSAVADRVQVYVLITVGDEAFVRVPGRGEVRMPAAIIAVDAEMPPDELPGRDFEATIDEKNGKVVLSDFALLNDPRI